MFKAEIVADSLSTNNHRLTTFLITFPRMILAELNTHRMLSKNSASSRAIPFHKMLETVKENPFIPIKWMKEHSGMQGYEYFENQEDIFRLNNYWKDARWLAMEQAEGLHQRGISKQICNRLLEPFMWHTVLISGTEWENFFALRAHPDAEIHMQKLAYMMLDVYNGYSPKRLKENDWHIPFEEKISDDEVIQYLTEEMPDIYKNRPGTDLFDIVSEIKVKVSTMMAARTSYTVPGGDMAEWTIKKYVEKHDSLLQSGHLSPFEHCAQVMDNYTYNANIQGESSIYDDGDDFETWDFTEKTKGWCGNYRGFKQYRKMLPNENRTDNRILKTSKY